MSQLNVTYSIGSRVIANLARASICCVACGSQQKARGYDLCPQCLHANPSVFADPRQLRRFARGAIVEREKAPTGYSIPQVIDVLRGRNFRERAFAFEEARKRRSYNWRLRALLDPDALPTTPYGWRFNQRLNDVFVVNNRVEDTLWQLATSEHASDAYPGEHVLARNGVDADTIERALRYPPDQSAASVECDSALTVASEIVSDMLTRPRTLVSAARHQEILKDWLSRAAPQMQVADLSVPKPKRRRIAVGFYVNGTFCAAPLRRNERTIIVERARERAWARAASQSKVLAYA